MLVLDSRASSTPDPEPGWQDTLTATGCTWDPECQELHAPPGKYFLHPGCCEWDRDGNATGRRWSTVVLICENFPDDAARVNAIMEIVASGFTEEEED